MYMYYYYTTIMQSFSILHCHIDKHIEPGTQLKQYVNLHIHSRKVSMVDTYLDDYMRIHSMLQYAKVTAANVDRV